MSKGGPVTRDLAGDGEEINRFRLVVLRLARRIRSSSSIDITPSQLAIVATLARYGPCTISQIAEHEYVRPPSASKIVSALETRGFAERLSDPADRRRVLIALSPEGKRFRDSVRAAGTSWLAAQIAELDSDEVEIVQAAVPVLERLLGSGERTDPPAKR